MHKAEKRSASIERCIALKALEREPANNDIHKQSQPHSNNNNNIKSLNAQ